MIFVTTQQQSIEFVVFVFFRPIDESANLYVCLDLMIKWKIHRVPIVDKSGELLNSVSQSRIVQFLCKIISRYPNLFNFFGTFNWTLSFDLFFFNFDFFKDFLWEQKLLESWNWATKIISYILLENVLWFLWEFFFLSSYRHSFDENSGECYSGNDSERCI